MQVQHGLVYLQQSGSNGLEFWDTSRAYFVRVTGFTTLPARVRFRDIPPGLVEQLTYHGETLIAPCTESRATQKSASMVSTSTASAGTRRSSAPVAAQTHLQQWSLDL